ncbi:MAG: Hint domain-containing protein [Maritimibacter sp.]
MFARLTSKTEMKQRRMAEFGGAYHGTNPEGLCTKGFAMGTKVATTLGWRAVEALAIGDEVMTFDNGVQRITAITRRQQVASDEAPAIFAPITVPAMALGNLEDMILLPEQEVMVESDAAETLYGDPFALLRAKDLVGYRGISQDVSQRPTEVVTLHFHSDEILYVEGGAMAFCAADVPGIPTLEFLKNPYLPAPYSTFKGQEARALVAAMSRLDAHSTGPAAAYAAYS